MLVVNGQCRKVDRIPYRLNRETQRLFNEGKMELELVPQGTFANASGAGASAWDDY